MLVTFKTKNYANIPMLGDAATNMLEMMDFGVRIPGAIDADNVQAALDNLRQALARMPEQTETTAEVDEDQPAVSLHTRAYPLIELLEAAVAEQEYVRWE